MIPPNTLILFEADGKFFQHPECLLKLPADAFDFIRLKFTSLDANEEAMSDNAMRFVKHLSKLRTVSFDQSDTTDRGVSLLAGFEKLEAISCGDTLVTGKCLSDLLTCRNLKFIRISAVQIANEELRHLKKLPLKRLSLGRCVLKPSGLKHVSQCSGLENLDIGHNPDINDTCVPHIMKMKELKELTVADTKISFKGMMQLSHQKIARITFPGSRSQYTSSQLKSISKAFPHVDFMENSPERVDADYQQLFSPTSH
ncbi:MAG: hypothetical protein IAF58_18070 [Leptolyngbya sp.]|nr:hypothetical protein [Candidatus Melainabacteria bacterium]